MSNSETLKNLEISAGNLLNVNYVTKSGNVDGLATVETPTDVWAGGDGGNDYSGQSASDEIETIEVFSGSGDDTSAGTGARTIRISGLKSKTSEIYESEDLIMNGTTPVVSSSTWWRVNSCKVLTAGSGGENDGIISCRHTTTTANIMFEMPIGLNSTLIGAYTVPYNRIGYIQKIDVDMVRSSGADGSGAISIRVREDGADTVFQTVLYLSVSTTFVIQKSFTNYIKCPALSDIKIRVETVSDTGTNISAIMGIIVIQD